MHPPLIGNDIVDLHDESNLQSYYRPGYVERCCSPEERNWLVEQADQYISFWKIWAAKEATYKVAIKAGLPPFRQPKRIFVTCSDGEWAAQIEHISVLVRMEQTDAYVHAVATLDDQCRHSREKVLPSSGLDVSRVARDILVEMAERHFGVDNGKFSIQYNKNRIPQLCRNSQPAQADISISHDGQWIACSLLPYDES